MDCWTAYGYPDIATQLQNERKQADHTQRKTARSVSKRRADREEVVAMIRGMLARMRSAGMRDSEIARRSGVSTTALRAYSVDGFVPNVVHADVFERISDAYVAFVASQSRRVALVIEEAPAVPVDEPKSSGRGVVKLTPDDVIAIRARHAAGETTRALGEEFGVNPKTIRSIAKYETWKHVLPDGTILPLPQGMTGKIPFHGELGAPVPLNPAEKLHHNAKLTPRQMTAIREEWAIGAPSALIAERYGVSDGTVLQVCRQENVPAGEPAAVTMHPWLQDDADRLAEITSRPQRRKKPELPDVEFSVPSAIKLDCPMTLRERLAARRQRDRQDGHT